VRCFYPLVCSFKRFARSAISRQIGRTCLVITLMVCLRLYDARIFSLKTSLCRQASLACKLLPVSIHSMPTLRRGAMCNFGSDSTSFSSGFPGVHPHLLTLTSNFTIPFYREILLLLGVCSVSKRSCERILRKGYGSAITIVVGGAAESLSAHPGTADLTLRRRYALCSISVHADQTDVFSDWGSSSSQFGKGVSLTSLRTYPY
jgi:hypothetical protein